MKQLVVASVTVLALSVVPAQASEWVQIAKGNGVSMEADLSTIVRNGGIVAIWVKTQFDSPPVVGGTKIGKTLARWQIRCTDRKLATGTMVFYDTSGNPVHTSPEGSLVFQDIVPDSAADGVANPVCR